ncbi:uncharacterized protein NPIL_164061 [Nephila pilipes]|uniref:Uncharacterized protein n=1 Tax=Nephila pilipes TaxID=299642 RepID=A0A8X6MC05_NEPPI|nr:uncharacterized protein NPIL_164061 [Nephila pilipes]
MCLKDFRFLLRQNLSKNLVYCILCVASQYQEFAAARNQPRQFMADNVMPVIEVEPPSINRLGPNNQLPTPKVVVSVIPNEGTSLSTRRPLLSSAGSSEFKPSGSPKLDACRASFSSTSEISFSSSDALASRRDSSLASQDVARPGLLSPVGEVKSLHDETLAEEDQNKSICLDIEDEEEETENRSLAGVSRFTVSGLFSTNIFRQIPSKVTILERCDPEEHPLSIDDAPSKQQSALE